MAKPKSDEYRHKVITDPVHGEIGLSHLEVDLINTQSFQRLRRLKQLGLAEKVGETLARLPKHWRIRLLGRWYLLHEPDWVCPHGGDRTGRASMIEMAQCMEGERLFAELSRLAGQKIPSPPFHVTRFFHGDPDGIAVPDQQTLERLGTVLQKQPI